MATFNTATTQAIEVDGASLVFRELGTRGGVPVIFLHHLTAVLDDWDPAFIDEVAANHHVVMFDSRGVGGSSGTTPSTISDMADVVISFVSALGFAKVDLFGFSLGGFVAQAVIHARPDLVRRAILCGTGPAGDKDIANVGVVLRDAISAASRTGRHPKHFLFFSGSRSGQASADDYLQRLSTRTERDDAIDNESIAAQLTAIAAWGNAGPTALETIRQPVLVANGDHDIMVPTAGSFELARRIPNARLSIFPDAGHGAVFQHRAAFVPQALAFLGDQPN